MVSSAETIFNFVLIIAKRFKGPLRAYLINLLFLTVIVVVKADAHFIAMDGENYTWLT